MADFIAILLMSLGTLIGGGANPEEISASIARHLMDTQPVPVEQAQVECSGAGMAGIGKVVFQLDGMLLDPLMISSSSISVTQMKQLPNGKMSIGGISWSAIIKEDDLTSALQAHVSKLKDAAVSISDKGITLSGTYPIWRARLPYEVTGNIEIQNDTQLIFKISGTDLNGLRVPAVLNKLIESEVNPVYDLAEFAARNDADISKAKQNLEYDFHLRVDSVKPGRQILTVKGGA